MAVVRGQAATLAVPLKDASDALVGLAPTGTISKDGGAFASLATAPTAITAFGCTLALSATETDCATATVKLAVGGAKDTVLLITPQPAAVSLAGLATTADVTAATGTITTAIDEIPIPTVDLTATNAAITTVAAQLYAAGAGSVSLGTPITADALVERGTDVVLTFDADTTGRTSTLTLYPQGSTTAALTVDGTATGATTAVSLTDAQTTALNGTYRMQLDSVLGSDTVRHIDGLLTAV